MRKINIAIFTWFNRGRNCGQTLQAYALQKAVSMLSNEKIVLNPIIIRGEFEDYYKGGYGDKSNVTINYLKRRYRQKFFESFVKKNLKVSKKLTSIKSIDKYLKEKNINVLLVGGDQLWNAQWTLNRIFFLPFLEKEYCIKASYGTGMMEKTLYFSKKIYRHKYEKYISNLKKFNYISVREDAGKVILKDLGLSEVERVLDPVFLLDKNEWNKIAEDVKAHEEYIFVYFLGRTTDLHQKCVDKICKSTGIKKVYYVVTDEEYGVPLRWKKLMGVGPAEFLGFMKSASYICTDSFHGMAFSIIYQKDFYVLNVVRKNCCVNFSRISEILSLLDLNDRYFDDGLIGIKSIDYKLVKEKLDMQIENSRKYLEKIFI